jgi:hypothetical protein
MPMGINSVAQITVFGSQSNQMIMNVFHYRRIAGQPGDVSDGDLTDALNFFVTRWRAMILQTNAVSYTVQLYRMSIIAGVITNPNPPPVNMFQIDTQLDVAGTSEDLGGLPGETLATFTAAGVRKLTDRAGRHYRGSFRLTPQTENDVAGNGFGPAFTTTAQTAVNTFVQAILVSTFGADLEMCVFARTLALRAIPPFTEMRAFTAKVLSAKLNTLITSQVSRKERPAGTR